MRKNQYKVFSVYILVILMMVMLAGCGGGESKPAAATVTEVKIAFMNPLSGSNVDAGKQDLNAAELAVEDINAAGGIKSLGGAKIKLVVVDTTSDPKQAASVAERTLSNEKSGWNHRYRNQRLDAADIACH